MTFLDCWEHMKRGEVFMWFCAVSITAVVLVPFMCAWIECRGKRRAGRKYALITVLESNGHKWCKLARVRVSQDGIGLVGIGDGAYGILFPNGNDESGLPWYPVSGWTQAELAAIKRGGG